MDIKEYVPKDKHDHERVEQLKKLSREDIKPIIPELMEWLQDQNWPVSQGVEDILINSQEDLIPHIKNVFQTTDGTWKYFLLNGLISRLPNTIIKELKSDLERMKQFPTVDEEYEDLDDILNELLERI